MKIQKFRVIAQICQKGSTPPTPALIQNKSFAHQPVYLRWYLRAMTPLISDPQDPEIAAQRLKASRKPWNLTPYSRTAEIVPSSSWEPIHWQQHPLSLSFQVFANRHTKTSQAQLHSPQDRGSRLQLFSTGHSSYNARISIAFSNTIALEGLLTTHTFFFESIRGPPDFTLVTKTIP
jgi:hypothetical protein